MSTWADREATFDRSVKLTDKCVTANVQPAHPVLVGHRQVRFEGVPTGQLHQDGSFYAAVPINLQSDHSNPDGPKRLFQRGLELDLVALVQAAAAWGRKPEQPAM
ncbi:hypothetical protein OG978_33265 [Streptomyces sp. NBC_01591]|uniref:hypothetical protein n=1 Tax=Streptomyces sp. NBC_01591 TaxID=2975888 RepID=UPI002DDAD109|nr:hypothetical protein [Streptomyces sp. NBC_01591]WSD71837.1 hypothetical protein OG978_33265 [Streptomyces sp. NBC_01591]